MRDNIALTLDTDWAPDSVIDSVASRLVLAGVRATWFVTHPSPAVTRLAEHPELFELGIHPNFMKGSTHGDDVHSVLEACLTLVPGARSMRTHGLFQSTRLFMTVLETTPICADASLFLPGVEGLTPFVYRIDGRELWRVPYCWQDDHEMMQDRPDWSADRLVRGPGLRVLNFHPIHVHLNSPNMTQYERLKKIAPRLDVATSEQVEAHVCDGPGDGRLFDEVISRLAASGVSQTISQVVAEARDAASTVGPEPTLSDAEAR